MASLNHLLCGTDREDLALSRYQEPSNYDKPNLRRCSVDNCEKTAKRGGRCIAHGGGNKCAVDGCTTSVVSRGLCVAHGGGKRCQTPACTKSAQSGGFCWVHGGGKKCGYEGCPKRAQSGGACIAHGGGKRCRMDGCNKVVQYDGLCVGHGGYRRCVFESCDRRAMANDYCQHHGGSSVCFLEHCDKRAVRGGMCSEHKAEASMQAVTASGLPAPGQLSDEDRRSRAVRQKPQVPTATLGEVYEPPTPKWQGTPLHSRDQHLLDLNAHSSRMIRHTVANTEATRSPSPVRRAAPRDFEQAPRGESPVAPGLAAILTANDKFPSFAVYSKVRKPADRYTRQSHAQQPPHPHHERRVYPVLPGIHALQNYRGKASSRGGQSSMVWCDSPLRTVKTAESELRIVVTEDPDSLKMAGSDDEGRYDSDEYTSGNPASRKLYVQSYYYRRNEAMAACSTTPTRRLGHLGGGRHT